MKYDLIESIGKELNIPILGSKDNIARAVYSVAGQMALASLWDCNEEESSISIQHFKERARHVFQAYVSIYPELVYVLPTEKTDLLDEIYRIYRRSGFFYHSEYQISPAVPAIANGEGIKLFRGCSPDKALYMSGLGFYSIHIQELPDAQTIPIVYHLQNQTFDNYLDDLLSINEWEPIEWPDNTEYLRLDPPFSGGYWKQTPEINGRISLARYGQPNKLYAFYYYHNGTFLQKVIPEWRVRDFFSERINDYSEYRRVATALLFRNKTLPAIRYRENGNFIDVRIGYRLPPSEEDFFKLFSWPIQFLFTATQPQVFVRSMAKAVFPAFRNELETIGYSFVEELQ